MFDKKNTLRWAKAWHIVPERADEQWIDFSFWAGVIGLPILFALGLGGLGGTMLLTLIESSHRLPAPY